MEIGGTDIIVPFSCDICKITLIIAKHWPDYVMEQDGLLDYFFYKNLGAYNSWENEDPTISEHEHYNEMIYVLIRATQTTLVVDELVNDVKSIVDKIHDLK